MQCLGCQRVIEDTELFCPHCGAAVIEQSGRFEQGLERERETSRRLRLTGRCAFIGIVVGLLVATLLAAIVDSTKVTLFGRNLSPLDKTQQHVRWLGGLFCGLPPVCGVIGGLFGTSLDIVRGWKRSRP